MEVPARASAAEAREGEGAVPLYNLMEDATTAEISRAQLWQWQRFAAPLDDGRELTPGLLEALIAEELLDLDEPSIPQAAELFRTLDFAERFEEYLTLPAYERLAV